MPRSGWELVFQDGCYESSLRQSWTGSQTEALWRAESSEDFLKLLNDFGTADDILLKLAIWCLHVYAQSMWTGPDLTPSENAQLPKSFSDKEALKLLATEGELMESLVDYPGALYIGRALLQRLCSNSEDTTPAQQWWLARSAVMHHRSLAGGLDLCDCPKLKQEVFDHYIDAARVSKLLSNNFSFTDEANPLFKILPKKTQASEEEMSGVEKKEDITLKEASHPTSSSDNSPDSSSPGTTTSSDLSDDEKCRLLIELLNVFTFYNLGSFFRTYLEENCESWPFSIKLTGRQGIRRIHQKDAIPQLCVIVKSNLKSEGSPLPFPRQTEVPRDIGLTDLDATNDILARPKFVDTPPSDQGPASPRTSLLEKFYLLAWANERLKESSVDDQIGLSVISSLTAEILETSDQASTDFSSEADVTKMEQNADWCLWGNALYTRSRTEYNRSKTRERSCLQILTLEEQVLQPSPVASERLKSLWLTGYPNKWELRREVGKKFREMGAPMTARDMFVKMHMWTDVIECLVSCGRKNEASQIVEEELKKDPLSPTLWFLKGEVTVENSRMDFFMKSWELSGHRFYKATNALAHHCLKESANNSLSLEERKALLERSLKYFKETVTLKPHLKKTQFTYGCLLMEHGSDTEALSAFNSVLLHTTGDEDYQVWANMGAIHSRARNWLSALKCFQQAARLAQNKWRIWDSYIKICFVLRDYLGALEGLQKILQLGNGDQIPIWMLDRLQMKVQETLASGGVEEEGGFRDQEKEGAEGTSEGRAEGGSGANTNKEGTSRRASEDHLIERIQKFFQDYFLQVDMPLPSRRNCLQISSIFDTEEYSSSIDRLEIWRRLSLESARPAKETVGIAMKCFREVNRVLEDCLSHECPKQFWKDSASTYVEMIKLLCDRWSRSAEELFDQLVEVRQTCSSVGEYEEKRTECSRLVEGSEKRLKISINGCSLMSLEERQECLLHLKAQ